MKRMLATRCLGIIMACLLTAQAQGSADKPVRLVLQLTIDGLRADLLKRYHHHFSDKGFNLLLDKGSVFTNAHYQHANTETIVGHATLATGAPPSVHGMIGNAWYDRESGQLGYNIEDADYPLLAVRDEAGKGAQVDPAQKAARSDGRSPRAILVPALADSLNVSTNGKSKIFAVSGKDRGAVSMAGQGGKAFWYSTDSGDFVTSSYYYESYPAWAAEWNAARKADAFSGREWQLTTAPEKYTNIERDDRPYEADLGGYGRVFPHSFGSSDEPLYYTRLFVSPYVDQLTVDFSQALIESQQLGNDDVTDYLGISLSGVDAVNHFFGPASLEQEALMRELDGILTSLFEWLDKRIGLQHVLVVLSADHGMAEMPEYMEELGFDAGRIYPDDVTAIANEVAQDRFGISEIVQAFFRPNLYLDRDKISAAGLDYPTVARTIASALTATEGIYVATTPVDANADTRSLIMRRIARNHHPLRSGDIYVAQSPYWFLYSKGSIAAMHGSPFRYDTHVPLIFMSDDIRAQRIVREVHPVDVAPTLAALLKISPPAGSEGTPLPEVLND